MRRVKSLIKNPYRIFLYLENKGLTNWIPDKIYLKLCYRGRVNENLNLKTPILFNEKLQWLKLYDRNQLYSQLVNKYDVRQYITDKIGEKYLIPLINKWNSVEEINPETLPKQFVIKCSHDSGGVFICKNKNLFDFKEMKTEINRKFKKNYFYHGREWPYKNIKPQIICEKLLLEDDGSIPKDYKFFCFHGEPKLIQVDIDRFGRHKQNFYDNEWNFRDVKIQYENDKNFNISKPEKFDEMIDICKKLSAGIPHVRVDLYYVNNEIFFGEMTFFHMSGMGSFISKELNKQMGEWIKI